MVRRSSSNIEMFFKTPMSHASSVNSLITSGVDCDSPTSLQKGPTDNAV